MSENMEQAIHSIMSEMFEIQQKSKAFVDIISANDGLSQNQIMLLIQLKLYKSMKITEIASTFLISPGAATSMCDKLENMNLVARVRQQEDRRVVKLVLTDKGTEKVVDLFKQFPHERLSEITVVFKKVNQLMSTIL